MRLIGLMRLMRPMSLIGLIGLISLISLPVQGQIKIGGNVYGGGNAADVEGNATVTFYGGSATNVFGGARMSNIGGRTFVNIDGKNAKKDDIDIVISSIYGGNDIAGTIGQSGETTTVPTELENVLTIPEPTEEELTAAGSLAKFNENYKKAHPKMNQIDNSWKTFVRSSRSTKTVEGKTAEDKWIIVGSLFGGGNGDYDYEPNEDKCLVYRSNHTLTDKPIATLKADYVKPELKKTYLEIKAGEIAYVYGGGNKATVKENTTIHIDNTSEVCDNYVWKITTGLWNTDGSKIGSVGDLTTSGEHSWKNYYTNVVDSLMRMAKLSSFQSSITNFNFNHGRIFGGNNNAEMSIRPTWNLQQGVIRDLYSGGNKGNMTSPEGLLVEIDPAAKNVSDPYVYNAQKNDSLLSIYNLYGGCRMADVKPTVNGEYKPCTNLQDKDSEGNQIYFFPNELAARVLVRGGHVTNVYGGNDVTGKVWGGNAVGIYSTVYGNVYGGGNGAYAYTNNYTLGQNDVYSDFYYGDGLGIDALNDYLPNAEQVSIRLAGKGPATPEASPDFTVIKGSVFVGGNCASLATVKEDPRVELKIGSYVIANSVYLGNNGEDVIAPWMLEYYKTNVDNNGNKVGDGEGTEFSSLSLTDPSVFDEYMEGVAMNLQPDIVFDAVTNGDPADYKDNTSYVGSFYCGGNVGSMAVPGKNVYEISRGLNIFEKFVGGSNNAYVPEIWTGPNQTGTQLCSAFDGGVLGSISERGKTASQFFTDTGAEDGKIKDRLEIRLDNLTITPLRWNDAGTQLIWNTQRWSNDIYTQIEVGSDLVEGQKYYTSDSGAGEFTAAENAKADASTYERTPGFVPVDNSPVNSANRLLGGNVYGGCYNSGHVNGNITIDINDDVLIRDQVFGTGESTLFGGQKSGVKLLDQRDDLNSVALIVFGGGYGEDSEVWGSTKVNLNNGYAFQICGGGEMGVVGKKTLDVNGKPVVDEDDNYVYDFDPRYSSTVNLSGTATATSNEGHVDDLAESEYLYAGGKEGLVCGNTLLNLGNGRIYDGFAGASEADILGHAEAYIGRQPDKSSPSGYKDAFPWIKDIVYGGNDFSGKIWGEYESGYNFQARIKDYDATKAAQLHGNPTNAKPGLLKSASYVEYLMGHVDSIYGGSYGYYDYKDELLYGPDCSMPELSNSFVNIRPKNHGRNHITSVFGGGTGYPANRKGDKAQNSSYVLIDIPDDTDKFVDTEVFGSGAYNGLGMGFDVEATMENDFARDQLSAIIDLLHGNIHNVYGGSFNEGVTARTVINVPSASTIQVDSIYGGAYGTQILPPCDVYESNVNYNNSGETAVVRGAIFGGNNHERRTLYTHINISSPVWSNKAKGYLATVYGAGRGIDTWSEYTDVNLNSGAKVYEVYGGGEMGHVLNAESIQQYMNLYKDGPSPQISAQDPKWKQDKYWHLDDKGNKTTLKTGKLHESDEKTIQEMWAEDWKDAWTLGDYYTPNADYTNYVNNRNTNLTNDDLVTNLAEIDDRDYSAYEYADGDTDDDKAVKDAAKARIYKRFNTNVRIKEGATVVNYAYGGGYGKAETHLSGDVYGTTYIALLGGTVNKDIYAAGTAGAVYDLFGMGHFDPTIDSETSKPKNPFGFTASANAYIYGGSCRNVYGGGWLGNVGRHDGAPSALPTGDIPGETHVVIGDMAGTSFKAGIPTVQRNAYGGGEGGAVFGTAYLTLNNGYIGYSYNDKGTDNNKTEDIDERYEEKIEDETKATPNTFLSEAGCLFGGGYIDNSSVDKTVVQLNGGHVRNSAFGGGEIAAIGRGEMKEKDSGTDYELKDIYRPGKTLVEMFSGHVYRNVFGGGRGYDNLGQHGTLHCDGYVFGQTEVHIHGGEIGTVSGVADGDGNVFGGCDIGHVYSAYEIDDTHFGIGKKDGVRYDPLYQGYYYKYENGNYVTVQVPNGTYTAEEIAAAKEGDDAYGKTAGDTKYNTERQFTEDCKVVVEPRLKVTTPVTINKHEYKQNEFVHIDDLNHLRNKKLDKSKWDCLDQTGIIIHNAVFAGGNTISGMATSANTASVFGNATASINDIYHRDMITLGTRHTGGLYGDGNLTLVDGYRELNITNYGTDYYSIDKEISVETYESLPDREADYYELRYTCLKECQDKEETTYRPVVKDETGKITSKASTITADEMQTLFVKDIKDSSGKIIKKESVMAGSDTILVYDTEHGEWIPNPRAGYWEKSGVLPVYAGRLMNSIQRADFCGVFGSRMVMQGAQDRVVDEVNYTNYTINRVREVSLNKKESVRKGESYVNPDTGDDLQHGNYFGIYNTVNYLGALTSDVKMSDVRHTDNEKADPYKDTVDGKEYGTATYYEWKKAKIKYKERNNGKSHNKVALASGVYLELTTEESTGDGLYEKVWGPITGVVELDLINVSTGIGGGYVYAKNQHGKPTLTNRANTTLATLNENAVTKWDYDYGTTDADKEEWETSGNFVHSTQTIIDDCYNISNKYLGEVNPDGSGAMPAHYWYIKGSVYVYDQYISAFTGSSNAYSESVNIPLTIAAASHGRMKLLNVQPNLYAFYASPGKELESGKRIIINDKTYYKNDTISYWDWSLLSTAEKELFVPETYVVTADCTVGDTPYAAGTVLLPSTYASLKASSPQKKLEEGDELKTHYVHHTAKDQDVDFDFVFRSSNNLSHNTGYILTYEVNNPSQWDNWYTPKTTSYTGKVTLADYNALDAANKEKYNNGPTYRLIASTGGELLGQNFYNESNLISKDVYDTYKKIENDVDLRNAIPNYGMTESDEDYDATKKQATFEEAWLVTNKITIEEDGGKERHYNVGVAVPNSFALTHSSDVDEAYICTSSIQMTKDNVIYKGSTMTEAEKNRYINDVNGKMNAIKPDASGLTLDAIKALPTTGSGAITSEQKKTLEQLYALREEVKTNIVRAYYCKTEGLYGGNYYQAGYNYRGLEAWSSMSEDDRQKFIFNYDALDLLIDPDYTTASNGANSEGHKYLYDGNYTSEDQVKAVGTGNKAGYSIEQKLDYTASYNSDTPLSTLTNAVHVIGKEGTQSSLVKGDELTRDEFETKLINERRHFSPIAVKDAGTYYVVHTAFQVGYTPYAVGEVVSSDVGLAHPENVTAFTFVAAHENKTYYYCREEFDKASITSVTKSETSNGMFNVSNENLEGGTGEGAVGGKVPQGTIITSGQYGNLKNEQEDFTIHGVSPTETSTLYVSRESDIFDLSRGKIITVIYQYDYDETDNIGNVTPISERHVLNIHITFKSGVPTIDDISAPEIILPGDKTSLREPTVTPGAYEITGYGWELFETPQDADSHTNGVPYNPTFNPLYWYQDGHYVAYYAKSYLGKTYSNAVPVSVANYHDLADVMADVDHHMYIDNKNVKRAPKIYINDYSGSDKDGLDHFKNLYDLSLQTSVAESGDLKDHALLNERVKGCKNLEFFLRTDINHPDDTEIPNQWTPIGNASQCFDGVFHGDGHTISGLDNSLFGDLCGEVYNLGVVGSFNTAGVADTDTQKEGYVESCWVQTTNTTPLSETESDKPYAVFGNPTDTEGYQLVNSYFWDGNKTLYNMNADETTSGGARGTARAMSTKAFYNGELAYNLNNFYLHKRYSDKAVSTGTHSYKYWKDGETELELQTGYYGNSANLCSSGYIYTPEGKTESVMLTYVENRFADGDFRFADGKINIENERNWQETISGSGETAVKEDRWSPIWPDDYIFFGQKLTYGYNSHAHQEVPTAVVRDGGRLSLTDVANRVYRAPAYYRSKNMGVAYFNPKAYLAQAHKDAPAVAINEPMTAIDFAGHNDTHNEANGANKAYEPGMNGDGKFYAPLLDDDGLTGIENCDETQNLLVYAPAATGTGYTNAATHKVLTDYFSDAAFGDHYDNSDPYRCVSIADEVIFGHLVQSDLKATNDHLLVDKQDFNAPIAYDFDGTHRMWYQRNPTKDEFVDRTKGWQGISIPFTADLVTTHQKGEITHFYGGSTKSANSEEKIGHEYWLRELEADEEMTLKPETSDVLVATFNYPSVAGADKTYTNTFLWDYYYQNKSGHDQKDANDDTYLQYRQYYKESHTHKGYSRLTKAKPYILGLPGKTYYEFDLSGSFEAKTTATPIPEKLAKQTITFASAEAEHIGISDDEMTGTSETYDGKDYYFKPNYMSKTLEAYPASPEASTTYDVNFVLNAAGSSYDLVKGTPVTAVPFRPYFTGKKISPASSRKYIESIVFSDTNDGVIEPTEGSGKLTIKPGKHKITVISGLRETTHVRITNMSGITLTSFDIEPGETIETPINMPGFYIVNKTKVAVR